MKKSYPLYVLFIRPDHVDDSIVNIDISEDEVYLVQIGYFPVLPNKQSMLLNQTLMLLKGTWICDFPFIALPLDFWLYELACNTW